MWGDAAFLPSAVCVAFVWCNKKLMQAQNIIPAFMESLREGSGGPQGIVNLGIHNTGLLFRNLN